MKKRTIGDSIDESNNENEHSRKEDASIQSSTRLYSENITSLCAELARLNTNTIQYLACAEILFRRKMDEIIAILNVYAAIAPSSRDGESMKNFMAHLSQLIQTAYKTKERFSESAEEQAILTSDTLNALIENLKRDKSVY